ncbi:MAG: hypothetical protein WD045_15285 [Pirellulaceae bacterium]
MFLTEILLNSYLGKNISEICLNGYDDKSENHCAHFVSHAANLDFGYTCRSHTGKKNQGANLRVHEVFARCAKTSEVIQCSPSQSGLVFISAPSNFVTPKAGPTTMRNVPKKHIGFLLNGHIWHYSNGQDQVVKQSLSQFLNHYPKQSNALWLGSLPPTSRLVSFGQC